MIDRKVNFKQYSSEKKMEYQNDSSIIVFELYSLKLVVFIYFSYSRASHWAFQGVLLKIWTGLSPLDDAP